MNPVGHAPIRGYCIATAIRPIVPVPLIGADPNWLGTEQYLLAALAGTVRTGHAAVVFVPSMIRRGATLLSSPSRPSAVWVDRTLTDPNNGLTDLMTEETTLPTVPCIYCSSTVPPTTREHVMPQALGTFEQNWTLRCVCDDCNHFFSRELELALGRDSWEGFLRVELGLRSASASANFLNKRMRATLNDGGYFNGAQVVMRPTEAGDSMEPFVVHQVGFRKPGEDWVFIAERDLTQESIARFSGSTVEIKVFAPRGDLPRVQERLAALDFDFTESHRVLDLPISEREKVTVEHEFNVDTTLRRAAGKIAFNYAAKILGPDAMRRRAFDPLRQFVRYDQEPVPLVSAKHLSVLEGPEASTTRTHICGLQWLSSDRQLAGIVSLFNEVTYGITMCRSESDEWATVVSGHLFDPMTHRITEVPIPR